MSAQSSRILSVNEALRAVKLDGKCDKAHTDLTRHLVKSPVATSADYRRTASWNHRDVTHEPSAQPVCSEERRRSA